MMPTICAVPVMQLFLHHLEDTCGAGGVPAGVVRVLNSKACRSSIMFGDELMPAQVWFPAADCWTSHTANTTCLTCSSLG